MIHKHSLPGDFDFHHLQRIHQYIFQDIYDWAGKIRVCDIAKTNLFCKVEYIPLTADEIFGELRSDHYLQGLSRDQMIERLSYYLGEINALHPFREGNGRTQREFLRELAKTCGYRLQWEKITPEEMLAASIDSFVKKYEKMEALFDKCIKTIK